MLQRHKTIIGVVIILATMIVGIFVIFRNNANAPTETVIEKQTGDTTQIESTNPTSTTNSATQVKTSEYVFKPYTSSALVLTVPVTLSTKQKSSIESHLTTTQKTIAGFTSTTPVDTKVNTLFLLAADQELLGHYGDAKKTLEQALLLGQNPYLLQSYASLLATMGDNKGAFIYIDQAIALNPKIPNFWRTKIDIAKVLYRNDTSKIEALYIEAIQKTDNDIDMITSYASYLGQIGKTADAVVYWKKAIEISPDHKDLYQKEIDLLTQ